MDKKRNEKCLRAFSKKAIEKTITTKEVMPLEKGGQALLKMQPGNWRLRLLSHMREDKS